jgi:hypothetical protein
MSKSGPQIPDIQRRIELGIAAISVILAQGVGGYSGLKKITDDIEKVRADIVFLKVTREQMFVKAEEFAALSQKLDKINEQVIAIKEHLKAIRVIKEAGGIHKNDVASNEG